MSKLTEKQYLELAENKVQDAFLWVLLHGMMRCMGTAANPCTLAKCENVTQLHAVLNREDLGILP